MQSRIKPPAATQTGERQVFTYQSQICFCTWDINVQWTGKTWQYKSDPQCPCAMGAAPLILVACRPGEAPLPPVSFNPLSALAETINSVIR